jgi:hypothetical protein
MYSPTYNFWQIFGKKMWRKETTWKTRAGWEKNIKIHNTETGWDSTDSWAFTDMIIKLTVPHDAGICGYLWLVITGGSVPMCFCFSCLLPTSSYRPRQLSKYSQEATERTTEEKRLDSSTGKTFLTPKCPQQLWDPTTFLLRGYTALPPWRQSDCSVKLGTPFQLLPKLTMWRLTFPLSMYLNTLGTGHLNC